jgi:hypothetical protein
MTIDEYLAELERRLPRLRRRRVVAEAEEHLRDAAARQQARGLSPRDAEAAAVADFGPVEVLARRLAAEAAVGETRIAAILALGAASLFVFPLYVVPENTLPPAPWIEKPGDVAALQLVMVVAWAAAVVLAAASAVLAWTRWSRLAAPVLGAAVVAIGASCVSGVVLVERWFAAAPATPSWPLLAAPLAAGCLAACGLGAAWALSRRELLDGGFVPD